MKKTNRNTTMGMVMGMCFGVSIGTSLGMVVFDNTSLGIALGLSIGLAIGTVLGAQKDKKVNRQMEEQGYTIKEIGQNIENEKYAITIVNRLGEESVVLVPKGQMEEESFVIGDVVFLDDDGMMEQAYDKEG